MVNRITPFELTELSVFRAWIRVFRRWVGILCFLTNPQSMQEMLAPLSIRALVSMAFIVCEGTTSCIGICIVGEEVLVSDSVHVYMSRGFNGGADEAGFVALGVGREREK